MAGGRGGLCPMIKRGRGIQYIPTGIRGFDAMTGGGLPLGVTEAHRE